MKAEVEILQPGLFSSLQDLGRKGFMEFGVPVSGAMDSYASGMANLLLQNSPDAAVMEVTQLGPKLKFSGATQIVVCGAVLSPLINGNPIENNRVYNIQEEDVISFGKRIKGCRAYLAVKGGFVTESFLTSGSWYSGITAHSRFEKGMKLEYEVTFVGKESTHAGIKTDDYLTSAIVETFPGPEFDLLSEEEKKILQNSAFSIDKNNNRMGIQLQEEMHNSLDPILTGPVLPGTVQLTPSGKLIVLMKDGQTTGGYPRVLQMSEKGINTIAQKVMGEKISFKFCWNFRKVK